MTTDKVLTPDHIDYYDDKNHDYRKFWEGRDYEHISEVAAIKKLLGSTHYGAALDLGGGYGRLTLPLLDYADKVYLVEPSKQQLGFAKKYLESHNNVEYVLLEANKQVPVPDNSIDLLIMVRVSHHLIDPMPTFEDIARLLKPGGKAIIEIANYGHALHHLKYALKGKKLPVEPVKVGKSANGLVDDTPFVNHNPKTIKKQLAEAQLIVTKQLSVSNLRNPKLKKILSPKKLGKVDAFLQPKLAGIYFGPSIFFLAEKQ